MTFPKIIAWNCRGVDSTPPSLGEKIQSEHFDT